MIGNNLLLGSTAASLLVPFAPVPFVWLFVCATSRFIGIAPLPIIPRVTRLSPRSTPVIGWSGGAAWLRSPCSVWSETVVRSTMPTKRFCVRQIKVAATAIGGAVCGRICPVQSALFGCIKVPTARFAISVSCFHVMSLGIYGSKMLGAMFAVPLAMYRLPMSPELVFAQIVFTVVALWTEVLLGQPAQVTFQVSHRFERLITYYTPMDGFLRLGLCRRGFGVKKLFIVIKISEVGEVIKPGVPFMGDVVVKVWGLSVRHFGVVVVFTIFLVI